MLRPVVFAAVVFAVSALNASAQEVRIDTVLVLKTGQEVRGQFVGFRNGLFTLRLADGRITIHGVGEVDRMQPATETASIPAPAQPAVAAAPPAAAPPAAPAVAPAAAAPVATPPAPPPAAAAPAAAPPSAGLAGAELEARACGPDDIKFPTITDKTQHPTPAPPADKAILYVLRPSNAGSRIQTRFAVNGSWVGANYGTNYFFLALDPGEHFLCSQAEDRSALALTVQPGKAYYLQQTVTTGMMKSRSSLDIVSDQDGQEGLTKSYLSVKREPK
jgi:hypothetical protein